MAGFDSSTFLGFQNKAHGGEKLYNEKTCGPGKRRGLLLALISRLTQGDSELGVPRGLGFFIS